MTSQTRMRNHWWWRPGWGTGRRFYTWHLTFDQPDVHRYANHYRHVLAGLDGLDPIPDRWLHLTTQGIGFVEDVPAENLDAITAVVSSRLSNMPAFEITFGTPVVDPEAILVPVDPAEPVRRLRKELRAAINEVMGAVPEAEDGFNPHVSIGYSNQEGPSEPFAAAIATADVTPAKALISHADLIVIHRDHRMYEWTTVAQVPLG